LSVSQPFFSVTALNFPIGNLVLSKFCFSWKFSRQEEVQALGFFFFFVPKHGSRWSRSGSAERRHADQPKRHWAGREPEVPQGPGQESVRRKAQRPRRLPHNLSPARCTCLAGEDTTPAGRSEHRDELT
jgi:hypothetical protein